MSHLELDVSFYFFLKSMAYNDENNLLKSMGYALTMDLSPGTIAYRN